MEDVFFLNGDFYDNDPFGDEIYYGASIFETIMIYKGKLIFLEEHINRLKKASEFIGIDVKDDELSYLTKVMTESAKNFGEGSAKILISQNNKSFKITNMKLREFNDGIKIKKESKLFQNELGFIKSSNYLGNIIARKNLGEKYFETIFLNREGYITEGSISNIFFISNNVLYTPDLNLNILPGITRDIIIKIAKSLSLEVQEGNYNLELLKNSDGIFFTNSLMKKGLLWVNEFEGIFFEKNELIHKLEEKYLKIIEDMI